MQKLTDTDYYIFTDAEAEQLQNGIIEEMKTPGPIVPSGCGPMMRVIEADDVTFLENALP